MVVVVVVGGGSGSGSGSGGGGGGGGDSGGGGRRRSSSSRRNICQIECQNRCLKRCQIQCLKPAKNYLRLRGCLFLSQNPSAIRPFTSTIISLTSLQDCAKQRRCD